jgi:hypothetical protein
MISKSRFCHISKTVLSHLKRESSFLEGRDYFGRDVYLVGYWVVDKGL